MMSKKRFVDFYLSALLKNATAGRVSRAAYTYFDLKHQETVTLYWDDGPSKIDVTGQDLTQIAKSATAHVCRRTRPDKETQ